jgi:hypothetical protein
MSNDGGAEMTDQRQPFRNEATQSEKRETLRNDNMNFRTSSDLGLENTGRFAKPFAVTGSTPAPQYPSGPNWANDPTGVEPPLGFDVNAIEPVGEHHEIQSSLAEAVKSAPSALPADSDAPPRPPQRRLKRRSPK